MPLTQDRLIALVEESERNLARIQDARAFITRTLHSMTTSADEKLTAIAAGARTILDDNDCKYTLLERERIKFTRRKNQYARDYMRRKRGTYSPRAERTEHLARAGMVTLGDGTIMPQAEFDRTVDAQLTASGNAPHEPDALERELARARELGDQERARNAERLARSATDMFPETGG